MRNFIPFALAVGVLRGTEIMGTGAGEILQGTASEDQIYGHAGDDVIQGLAGNDLLFGDEGIDVMEGGEGNDRLIGGTTTHDDDAGNDFAGGPGNDAMWGTAHGDVYRYALGDGLDLVYEKESGVASVDIVTFGNGIAAENVTFGRERGDLMVEISGIDCMRIESWFAGESGEFRIEEFHFHEAPPILGTALSFDGTVWTGGPGGDIHTASGSTPVLLSGLDGNDTLTGTSAMDVINGGGGADTLHGMGGDDGVYGDAGNDVLYGQDGDDALYGGNDNDTLLGEAGADHLTGGAGSDTQHGGAGNDSYFWNPGGGDDVIQDDTGYAERYAISRLIFGPGVLPADVTTETVPGSSTHIKFQVRASGVPAGSVQVNQWNTLHSYSSIRHGSTWSIEFADGTVWNGAVLATPLADTIAGTAGTDQISGGAGNDILSGMDGDDSLAGDEGDDILYAGSGNDILNGGLDNDTLLGEEGADQITGGAGNDTQHGGAGDDVYFWNPGDGDDVIQEDTGYSERYATSRLIFGPGVLPADVTTETVPGSSTHLRFQIRASGVPVGSVQVNQWNALHSYTSIRHCGTWHIEFANGTVWNGATLATPMADTLTGTPGADQMSGGGGNDILSGMDGDDTLAGDAGDDILYGGNDNDTLQGGADADTLFGEAGNDSFLGGDSNDTLFGGPGSDTYFWNPGDGDDTIQDDTWYSETSAINRLVFGLGVLPSDVVLETVPGSSTHIRFQVRTSGIPSGSVLVNQWNTLHSYTSIRHNSTWRIEFADGTVWNGAALGTPFADTLVGTPGADQMSGGAGNDSLSGMDGDDSLAGDAGDDNLDGGSGNDTLVGGTGDDMLNGGEGADIYASSAEFV